LRKQIDLVKTSHKILFWSHLIAAVTAGAVILIMSATGVILMYERQMLAYAERGQRTVIPPADAVRRLALDELVARARGQNSDARPTGVVLRNEATASVAVSFGRDGAVYMDPYTGAALGKESKLHDWFHDVIVWHRWLGQEGEGRATARAITGACNLAFFWLAITGVYLWWPRSWHWRGLKSSLLFNSRLRGKARDWNWHNVIGFWSSGVLVILTVTSAVMSYPWANDLLYFLTGSEPPPRAQSAGPAAQPQQRRGDGSAREPRPMTSFDALFARAEQKAPGWITMTIRLPPRAEGPINVLIQEPSAPHIFARSELQLSRSTAEVIKWEPYASANPGRKARLWVRGLHTGEAFGLVGQTAAGLASLGGCFLVWTGMAMAWRRFRYRKRDAQNANTVEYPSTAEEASIEIRIAQPNVIGISKEPARIEMEEANTTATNGHIHIDVHEKIAADWGSTAFDNRHSVLILYATVTGTAETVAHKLAAELRSDGLGTRVRDMAQCQPNVLTQAGCVLLVVSTYGDGEPPEDARPFWQAVVEAHDLNLTGIKYSVLALGNTTFDQFCKCGRDFDAALERHGAIRIYPRVDCDVDYDLPAKRWLDGVRAHLLVEDRNALSA
jgi:uncharacterized iron-regulated membrane protein/flavodoxin